MASFFGEDPPGFVLTPVGKKSTKADKADKITRVPLLDSVSAGKHKTPATPIPEDEIMWLSFSDLGRGDYFALQLENDADSMDRISPPNSVIVIDKADRELRNGKYYVFSIDGETTYKMWQDGEPPYLAPYSTNPAHRPIFIKRRRGFDVIGRVKRTVLDL
jgi:SOS-response transcriptional repressor LexA